MRDAITIGTRIFFIAIEEGILDDSSQIKNACLLLSFLTTAFLSNIKLLTLSVALSTILPRNVGEI